MDLFMSLSWGMYKWLCIVSCQPSERKSEVQLLDAPMFIQRRLDPEGRSRPAGPGQAGSFGGYRRAS